MNKRLIESLFVVAFILVIAAIVILNSRHIRANDAAIIPETQRAALSHERGRAASKIKDLHERQSYIAAQGEAEEDGSELSR